MTLKFVLLAERHVEDALRVILLRGGLKVRSFRGSAGTLGSRFAWPILRCGYPLSGLA